MADASHIGPLSMPNDDNSERAHDLQRDWDELHEALRELRHLEELKLERERLRLDRKLAKMRENGHVPLPLESETPAPEKETAIDPVEYRTWVLDWQRAEARTRGKKTKMNIALTLGFHQRNVSRHMKRHGLDPRDRKNWPPSRWDPDNPPQKPVA